MTEPYKILFICTGNACRSQMAEALMRHLGGPRFEVSSAGSNPAGYIHPLAVETMEHMGVPMENQSSKGWLEFTDKPQDIIITVCDSAACTPAPPWPGDPIIAHWGLPDPSFVAGSDEQRLEFALGVAKHLVRWIEQILTLPLDELSKDQLKQELANIAQT